VGSCPRPETWLALPSFPGFPAEKLRRLQGIAEEALAGQLDTERLRSLPYAEAQAQLLAIHGVGPWSADGILVRGCGLTDAMAMSEPRVFDAVGRAYALGRPTTAEEVHALSESWRPFRTWITVLLVCEHFDAATNARSRSARRSGASRPSADSATSP